ncbi:MAG: helicase-exonuclease AddAB subunit AddA [Lachnospiraceae bacterium]|nr:helicase-exonuclease AddAB subunit AddA [Lachnospiraceae bacterium]
MGVIYTTEQQRVIDETGKDILVSAAAGSGKTAVLVARILRMITDKVHPVDIDRLLIVTFTKAAADEMRERISRAIQKQLLTEPDNQQLQRQATYIHKAQITTIDSFCKYLISNHFEDIGVDPSLRVADEAETRLLMKDVMAELMEEKHVEAEEEFINCLECFATGKAEETFEEQILKLFHFAMSYPWPKEWLREGLKVYACESEEQLMQTSFMQELLEEVRLQISEAHRLIGRALSVCDEPDGPYMYGELLGEELAGISALLRCETYDDYYQAFSALSFGRLPSKKDASVSPDKRELVKNLRAQAKELLSHFRESYFALPAERAFLDIKGCQSNVEVLVETTLAFMDKYAQKKAEKKLMDFPDMEHMALDILYTEKDGQRVPSATALLYRDYFEEIMIDEYQDSNLVQELLLMSMVRTKPGGRNCFMVGDVKQSIYKFRLARPEIFMDKYAAFGEEGEQIRIDLHQNFRSRSEVLTTVNRIFEQIMDASLGGITYDESAKLNPGASYEENPDCAAELLLYECKEEDEESSLTGREGEAEMVALRIQNMVGQMEIKDEEKGGARKVRYGDIVILLRSAGSYGQDYKKALEKRGIPVYIPVSTGYFAATEIRELLDYLKVLNNPYHDVPLCGLLKSPFFEFTDEELAQVKGSLSEEEQKLHYYEAMKRFVQQDEEWQDKEQQDEAQRGKEERQDKEQQDEEQRDKEQQDEERQDKAQRGKEERQGDEALRNKVDAALQTIGQNRRKAVYLSVYELLLELMRQSNYMEYEAALPAGGQRKANLEMLLQKAADFEQTSYHGLFDFVRYMEQLEKYEVDFGEAGILDEHMDAVRIMTIHKSKGLEFPVCFVCGLSKRYNMTSAYDTVLLDMELGIAVDYMDAGRRIKAGTIYKRYLSDKVKKDSLGEEMRILYVALTRAKEKLIMTGNVTQLQSALKPFAGLEGGGLLPYAIRSSVTNSLTFILAAFCNAGCLEELCQIVHEADVMQADFRHETRREYRKEVLLDQMKGESGGKLYRTLKERFAFEYPYQMLSKLYTKTSVSELKKAAMEEDEDVHVLFETDDRTIAYLPKYMREGEEAGGAERGSAYHKVLELLSYEKYQASDVSQKELCDEIGEDMQRFVDDGLLSEAYRQLVLPEQIAAFLQSQSAGRLGQAAQRGKLFKEQPFVMQIPANLLGEEFPEEEGVLIQGIIDVYFEEKGELVVLDYKTDRVREAQELISRYQTQLDYYANALEKLTGMHVKEKLIYSFALRQEIAL